MGRRLSYGILLEEVRVIILNISIFRLVVRSGWIVERVLSFMELVGGTYIIYGVFRLKHLLFPFYFSVLVVERSSFDIIGSILHLRLHFLSYLEGKILFLKLQTIIYIVYFIIIILMFIFGFITIEIVIINTFFLFFIWKICWLWQ